MKHCIDFEPIDVWFLKDNERFTDRVLHFGICPVCNKPLAQLIEFDNSENKYSMIKKIGISSENLVKSLKKEILYTKSSVNKLKFKPNTFKWVYGINVEKNNCIKQYAADFFGQKVLICERSK